MTCHDAREQFSAFLDDALTAAERSALEMHLATCPDCRRELEQLRGTVTLLGRLGPVHAPPGFVDRVMAQAYRRPWPRRLLDALFRPLRVKLPLEAAAVLLVGISALYVYERTPEVRQLARPAAPVAPAPPAAAPSPMTGTAEETPRPQSGAAGAKIAPAEQERAREAPPSASLPAAGGNAVETPSTGADKAPAPMTDLRSAATPAPPPEVKQDAKTEKKETQAEPRPDAVGAPAAAAPVQKLAKSAEPSPSRDALTPRPEADSGTSAVAPPAGSVAAPGARGSVGGASAAAPAAPPPEAAAGDAAAQKSRSAVARLMRVADASGRLVVPAAEPAEVALDALLSRLGATRVARRVERTPGPILIDINVPVARYHELLEGLGRIGRWTVEYEVKTLPPLAVRLEVAISVEP
jgi:anti-sigma factor RsiW